jgi:hypothetical protein
VDVLPPSFYTSSADLPLPLTTTTPPHADRRYEAIFAISSLRLA